MSRNLNRASQVFRTGKLIREYQRQQILRSHPLQLWRYFAAAAPAGNGQRARGIPAPADIKHWRAQQSLRQNIADSLRIQIFEDAFQGKAVSWSQRKYD